MAVNNGSPDSTISHESRELKPSRNGSNVKAEEERPPVGRIAAGRPFVRAGQRFISAAGPKRVWAYVGACGVLGLLGLNALQAEQNMALQSMLAHRQVLIVGMDKAHELIPVSDGAHPLTCDALCVDGQLEGWIKALRFISGEPAGRAPLQHDAHERVWSMVAIGSSAEGYVNKFDEQMRRIVQTAPNARIDVESVRVALDDYGRYEAHWTEAVSDARNGHVLSRNSFNAYITAHVDPDSRNEDQLQWNPGGVLITAVQQFGE